MYQHTVNNCSRKCVNNLKNAYVSSNRSFCNMHASAHSVQLLCTVICALTIICSCIFRYILLQCVQAHSEQLIFNLLYAKVYNLHMYLQKDPCVRCIVNSWPLKYAKIYNYIICICIFRYFCNTYQHTVNSWSLKYAKIRTGN